MAKLSRLISFNLLPASWGLKGKTYQKAEAEYYYDGEDLERRLLEIEYSEETIEKQLALLSLDKKYKKISDYEADYQACKIDGTLSDIKILNLKHKHKILSDYEYKTQLADASKLNDTDKQVRHLEIQYEFKKITRAKYEKERANLLNEPWIGIVDHEFDPAQGVNGLSIEFDWNDQWIIFLRANGYTGNSEDEIVELWLEDVNRSVQEDDSYNFVSQGGIKTYT